MPARAMNDFAVGAPTTPTTRPTSLQLPAQIDRSTYIQISSMKDTDWTIRYPVVPQPHSPARKVGWAGGRRKKRRSGIHAGVNRILNPELAFVDPHFELKTVVEPAHLWESMKSVTSFMKQEEYFRVGQVMFINRDETIKPGVKTSHMEPNTFWLGRLVEIRVLDTQHVWLRIHWYYWPEELPGGRQPWHGRYELFPSNHSEIVDALTVSGRATVREWDEMPLTKEEAVEHLYWRAKYHCHLKVYSPPNKYCCCEKPINPDVEDIPCTNTFCQTWLHRDCIVESAARTYYEETVGPITSSNFTESIWGDKFKIRLRYKVGAEPTIIVTDHRNSTLMDIGMDGVENVHGENPEENKVIKRVACLVCHEYIPRIEDIEGTEQELQQGAAVLKQMTDAEPGAAQNADVGVEVKQDTLRERSPQQEDTAMVDVDGANDNEDLYN